MAQRAEPGPPRADWMGYDDVAGVYARISSLCHGQLARDLVEATAVAFSARVLDLGAGSGMAAAAAAEATGTDGFVVALDPAPALLAHARDRRVSAVVGSAPGLPFPDAAFDTVVASLVIGHFEDYRPALADMVRVLRPRGRLGLATWGRLEDAPSIDDADERAAHSVWDDVVSRRADLHAIDEAAASALPWETWFADPARVRAALGVAGFRAIECFGRAYRYPLAHADWVARIGTSARGRFVHAVLGEDDAAALDAEVLAALHNRQIPDPIRCADEAILTVAVAPSREVRAR